MGSMIGHRIDYNGVGVLRGQQHIPSKNWPKYPPPPPGLVGSFLHENHVTSQGHAAHCDSLAGISAFPWLLEDNKRENDSSKRVRKDHKVFLSGDGCIVYSSLIIRSGCN